MVRVPERGLVLGLTATEYPAVPLPEPVLDVVIHVTLLEAVQAQPTAAVTLTLPGPPLESKEALLEASE